MLLARAAVAEAEAWQQQTLIGPRDGLSVSVRATMAKVFLC
jgi:hypothetical protein